MSKVLFAALAVALTFAITGSAVAKGGSHSTSASPGTGSKASATHVHGYTKKDGTYVEPHQRSTPDKKFENNYTTKGNQNPSTGKDGSRVSESDKK